MERERLSADQAPEEGFQKEEAGGGLEAQTTVKMGGEEDPDVISPEQKEVKQGLLELIYGVLFDPVKTFKRIAVEIPVGRTVLIFSIVKLLSLSVVWYTLSSGLLSRGDLAGLGGYGGPPIAGAIIPVIMAVALIYEYVKWFVYSGALHLLADLAGGSGRAAGVLVTTGLAALPALLFLPFQILAAFFSGHWASGLVSFLIALAGMVWGYILVVVGIRETQRLGTGSAVLIALVPAGVIILVILIFVVLMAAMLMPMAGMID